MEICNKDKSNDYTQELSCTDKFNMLFSELEDCDEDEQRKKIIEEMNGIIEEMSETMLYHAISEELFNKINNLIEEKKLSMENAILLLKHIGYSKVLNGVSNDIFDKCLLSKRIQRIIFEEDKKKGGKKENLLGDLCVCYIMLYEHFIDDKLLVICVLRLLKIALKKEEDEITQKEVEMALIALNSIKFFNCKFEKGQFLNEIEGIVQYHQEHHNLTRIAYLSAWQFLIYRFFNDKSLNDVIVNELHFVGEARRELEEQKKYVDWKRKEDENEKETKEEFIFSEWIGTLDYFFISCSSWNEEYVELIRSFVQIYQAAKEKSREISYWCICSLRNAAKNEAIKVEDLLESGAVGAVLEGMQQPTLNDKIAFNGLKFLIRVSRRLKEKEKEEMEEEERKATKRKVFEKLEEEGYEDVITCFHEIIDFLSKRNYHKLSLNLSDYFVYI
ncbi:uncharacterized protein MONOS_18202 [Monocercomonoides exilis]|uniref:uncharacterized protein n=1 Tax=Monocercomonoides exilis TaxID=2049356 RepID=UPI0035593A58|nr:hypothetical protein MONOS_18202 [Monocercomonoides exilis]